MGLLSIEIIVSVWQAVVNLFLTVVLGERSIYQWCCALQVKQSPVD